MGARHKPIIHCLPKWRDPCHIPSITIIFRQRDAEKKKKRIRSEKDERVEKAAERLACRHYDVTSRLLDDRRKKKRATRAAIRPSTQNLNKKKKKE